MIRVPERSAARDAALREIVLPRAARDGWRVAVAVAPADRLFPGSAVEAIEAWGDLADRMMVEAASADLPGLRLAGRVRRLIEARLAVLAEFAEAERRAVRFLALPGHGRAAARIAARTVEAIWTGAGDRSADFSWYTKRAILGAVWGTTLLYALRRDFAMEPTLAFLDRRLADVGRIGKWRARMRGA